MLKIVIELYAEKYIEKEGAMKWDRFIYNRRKSNGKRVWEKETEKKEEKAKIQRFLAFDEVDTI